jgi:hypothetical protein
MNWKGYGRKGVVTNMRIIPLIAGKDGKIS